MKQSRLHILTIPELRKKDFSSSVLNIEKKMDDEEKYESFIVSYSSENLKIYGYLMVPKGEKSKEGWPVIIFNRGYVPEDEFQTEKQYVRYMAYLAKAGFIVFKSDYRGHGKSQGSPETLLESGYAVDVLNAISSIKKFPNASHQKIGIWGHSLGGDVSLKVSLASKEIKAAVILAAPLGPYLETVKRWANKDLLNKLSEKDKKRRLEMLKKVVHELGNPEDNPKNYQRISPVSYVKDLQIPLQLHHVISDDRVPFESSQNLYDSLKKLDKKVELYLYENGDHNFSGPELKLAMQRTIEFFKRFLN